MGLTELRKNSADLGRLCTDKERRFVLEYALDGNGTQAALRAGYSKSCAANVACRLLKDPVVKAYLGALQRKDVEKLEVDRLMVLKRLIEALNWEARDFVDENGIALKPHELPDHVQKVVDGFEQEVMEKELSDGTMLRHVTTKYKITPRAVAREQAMKHKGLFAPEVVNVNHVLRKNFLEALQEPIPADVIEARLVDEEQKLLESEEGEG